MGRFFSYGLVIILMGVVPVLSFKTARRSDLRLIPKIDLYLSAVLSQWVLALLAAGVVGLVGPGFRAIGFRSLPHDQFIFWTGGLALGALAALGLVVTLERFGLWPEESDLVRLLIPGTRGEKLLAVGLMAPTAAFCEELLYRGYLHTQLLGWSGSVGVALILGAAAFGLAHAYQGVHGMARAALLGALLAVPVIRTGSLWPSMAAHFVIDAVALIWLGPRLLRADRGH